MDLQKISKQTKKEANILLRDTDLISKFEKFGKVFIRGSYELDLMMCGDIDIYIVNKKLDKEKSILLLNQLIKENLFRGYFFYDFVKRRKKGFPKGYYIGLKTKINDKKWKIDIWLMNEMHEESDKFINQVKNGLDEVSRNKILEEKYQNMINYDTSPSYLIYKKHLGIK